MKRQFVSDVVHQESIDDIFRASGKTLRPNRNGNLFLQVQISDKSGTLSALIWNATENLYRSFENGDYVRVEGTAQIYQGTKQVIATRISRVGPEQVDEGEFVSHPHLDAGRLRVRLEEKLRGITDPNLLAIAEAFLGDAAFMEKFCRAPAGIKHHHAYHGGLLEHVVSLMELVQRVTPCYPDLDHGLLLMGAFLHDAGKIDELSYELSFEYTDEGQLVGHLVMAVIMLEDKARIAEQKTGSPMPAEMMSRLRHMIVSHHGEYEFGSPKLPMTMEALALNILDNLDAKLHAFRQLIRDDPNTESGWTTFQQSLNRKIFKGKSKPKG